MKVVVLCGGLGTRLREETEFRPKPLVEVGGRPILWHIMKGYAHHGFKDFVLCLGYKGWLIKEFFLNYRSMSSDIRVTLGAQGGTEFLAAAQNEDWRITLADTGDASMTGARVAAIKRYVDGDDLLMCTY